MRSLRWLAVAAPLAAVVASCGSQPAPTAPAVTPTVAVTLSLAIGGFDRYVLEPGLTIQLSATLTSSDGSKQDCTSTATWSSLNDALIRPVSSAPGQFLVVGAGNGSVRALCGSVTADSSVHVDAPASWPISGQVVSGANGTSVGGATFMLDNVSIPVDSAGRVSFRMAAASAHLVISAPGFVTRDTTLTGGQLRTGLTFDLIPNSMLLLFQEMVHARVDNPNNYNHAPLIRWTEPPNFYIQTNWQTNIQGKWQTSGQPINPAGLAMLLEQLPRMVGLWTGGRLTAGRIETGPEERLPQAGAISIYFRANIGNQGGYSPTQNIGFMQMGSDGVCGTVGVLHELGHAMGVWHSSLRPSIMGGGTFASCTPAVLTPEETAIANMMYGRPRGNTDPDVDPPGSAMSSLFKKGAR